MTYFFVMAYRSRDENSISLGPYNSYSDAEIEANKWFGAVPKEEWPDSSYDIIEFKD